MKGKERLLYGAIEHLSNSPLYSKSITTDTTTAKIGCRGYLREAGCDAQLSLGSMNPACSQSLRPPTAFHSLVSRCQYEVGEMRSVFRVLQSPICSEKHLISFSVNARNVLLTVAVS